MLGAPVRVASPFATHWRTPLKLTLSRLHAGTAPAFPAANDPTVTP